MDEVALVSTEQQKFQKSLKGIKNLLKTGKIQPHTDNDAKQARSPKKHKKPKKQRGLVYISHIPHGFYENEMTQYFRQFGVVTSARVLRSRRTGRSRGAAFVEFLEPAVAEIVAETMNNYLMGKRLLKAEVVPPERQKKFSGRKNWNTHKNPSSDIRLELKKKHNQDGTDSDDLKLARRQLKNVLQTKKKLKELGIDYDFFQPVDVPQELLSVLNSTASKTPQVVTETHKVKENTTKAKESSVLNTKTKGKKNQNETPEILTNSKDKSGKNVSKKAAQEILVSKTKQTKKEKENIDANKKVQQKILKNETKKSEKQTNKKESVVQEKDSKKNKKLMKFEGQNFIKIDPEELSSNEESDSDDEFDSDEFEMTIESDEEDFDSDDGEATSDGSEDKDLDDSEEEIPPPKQTTKKNVAGKANGVKTTNTAKVSTKGQKRKLELNPAAAKNNVGVQKKNKKNRK